MVIPRHARPRHRLSLREECVPVKQKLRRVKLDMLLKIKEEVKKQLDVRFLKVAKYPQWMANIVLVPKKDGKVRMCVDYQDLNRASHKDNFLLPHIDTLVDNTAMHSSLKGNRCTTMSVSRPGMSWHDHATTSL